MNKEEFQLVNRVAEKARFAMAYTLLSRDTAASSKELARAMSFMSNRAKFGILFMELSRASTAHMRPKEVNLQLAQWLAGPTLQSGLDRSPRGFLSYPKDVTKAVKALTALGVYCNKRERPRKKWGRPITDNTSAQDDAGGRPSFYTKSAELQNLEGLFRKQEARELLFQLLNFDLLLFYFVKFTLTILCRLYMVDPNIVEVVTVIARGVNHNAPNLTYLEALSNEEMDRLTTLWAIDVTASMKDELFFLFGLLNPGKS